jgi:hypothetical protein
MRLITLMMEAASTFETLVNFFQSARHNNPEDSHCQQILSLHTHSRLLLEKLMVIS